MISGACNNSPIKTSSKFLNDSVAFRVLRLSRRYRDLIVFILSILLLVSSANVRAATVHVLVGSGGDNFSPANVSIQVGDTVQWDWVSGAHSTTSGTSGTPNGIWDSGVKTSGSFSHTFNTAGSFPYYCTPHASHMVGNVNVVAGTATPTPIPKGPIRVHLSQVATGLTAPGGLVAPGDGSGRLFIVQQTGQVLILKNGAVGATPFLNVASRLVPLSPGYDERGLLGFAFHPDFNTAFAPGYRKVYTYTSEPVSGAADFTVPNPNAFNHQSVIAEWQVSSGNPDLIDPGTRREVMRIDQPQSNHNGGDLHFRAADEYLYISLGDGGASNDVGPGHNPTTGNAQDKSTVLGKILRIDPLNPALTSGSADPISANGKYRVPASNPFIAQAGVVPEIYVLGLRNPYRFGFDATSDKMIIGDVGQGSIEELDIGLPGKNYGWNKKEGSYLFNPASGTISPDPSPDPAFTDPVAQYSHSDGIAVIGGFIYRGTLLPALSGKYVFGDLAQGSNGRLFYTDLADGLIRELRLSLPEAPLGMYLKGIGRDPHGELYVLADPNIGPSGTGAKAFKIATIPPATAVSRKMHGANPFDLNLLTVNPAIECRSGGAGNNYQILFTFLSAVTVGGGTVTPGAGGTAALVGSPSPSPDGKTVTVNLANVSNVQTITVTLTSVNDGTNTYDVSVQMAVLVGDVNANKAVTNTDVAEVKGQISAPVTESNFRNDVTANGIISNTDVGATKAQISTSLP